MSRFPCPNPTCSFVFDSAQIPPGVTLLACPLCRVQFPYQPPPMSAVAPDPGPSPWATPMGVTSAAPPAPPEPPVESGGFPGPPAMIRVSPSRPSGGFFNSTWFISLFFLLVSGGLIVLYFTIKGGGNPFEFKKSDIYISETFNFQYPQPGEPWQLSPAVRDNLQANVFGLMLPGPDQSAWVAMAAQDFERREPRRSEVIGRMHTRLRGYFRNLQSQEMENPKWAGQPSVGLYFSGTDPDGSTMEGEAYGMSYRGVAYWFFAWAPQGKFRELADQFTDLRQRVKLLHYRDNWYPDTSNQKSFSPPSNPKPPGYQVTDTEGFWRESPSTAEDLRELYDPFAVYHMTARDPKQRRDSIVIPPDLFIYELPEVEDDALAQARAYVEQRLEKEAAAASSTAEVTEITTPMDPEVPEPNVPMTRLEVNFSESTDATWFVVVSALKLPDKLVVVDARCRALDRRLWEYSLLQIAGSLEAK